MDWELDFSEEIKAKKRIPEKKKDGTKRPKSKHSDLYTDEDPKGTIKGLGFKDSSCLPLHIFPSQSILTTCHFGFKLKPFC